MKVSIVIPAYNEEKRIGKKLEVYSSYFELLRKNGFLDYEILIVINNTTDKTEEVVKKYQKTNKRILYVNLVKGGKGYAVIEGFKLALSRANDLIGFVDADLATPPEAFYLLIKEIGNDDAAIANRYAKDSRISPKFTFRRTIVAKSFNFLVRALFLIPTRDTQCGAKIFTRKAAQLIADKVRMSQYAFDVEMLYILDKNNMRVKEVKTVWKDMEGSKIDIKKSSVQMFFAILRLRVIESPFKRLLNPVKPLIGVVWRLVR